MMNTVTTTEREVEVGDKGSLGGAKALGRNMIGEAKVNQRKMVLRILTPDQVLHTIGIGEVEEEGVEEIIREAIPEFLLQRDLKEAKTQGTAHHKVAGEILGAILQPVLTTAGLTPLCDTHECSGGIPLLPEGAEAL